MTPQITLIVDEGNQETQRVLTFKSADSLVVGRDKDARIHVTSDRAGYVSRRHCMFEINPPNIRVCDLGSLNGTFVNGKSIGRRTNQFNADGGPQEYGWRTLYGGDVVTVGSAKIRVVVFRTAGIPAPIRNRRQSSESLTGGLRVLVVDDNADAADSLAMILKAYGHEVHVAYSGAAALGLIKSKPPQAALLDIAMPEIDGYQLGTQLRRLAPHMLLIALTGDRTQEQRLQETPLFDQYFFKPADPKRITNALRQWEALMGEGRESEVPDVIRR